MPSIDDIGARRTADDAGTGEPVNGEAAIDILSYNLSHDLQAPLRAIRGFAQILADTLPGTLDDEHRRYLELIVANTDRMRDLLEGLRRYHELARFTPRHVALDMGAIVAREVEERRAREPERAIAIDIQPLPRGRGDPERIREVWGTLVDNALKFTHRTARPAIEIGHEVATGAWFVRDNGAGFDMQRADRLFTLFQRLHSADDFPGAGVGLALASGIVQRHGGRLWAEASPDEGATFRFTLPDGGGGAA